MTKATTAEATFDLDAFRAAQSEKTSPEKAVKVDGEMVRFHTKLPVIAVEALAEGEVSRAFRLAAVDEDEVKGLLDGRLTLEEVNEIFKHLYGADLGN